jgi:hypothetical protein
MQGNFVEQRKRSLQRRHLQESFYGLIVVKVIIKVGEMLPPFLNGIRQGRNETFGFRGLMNHVGNLECRGRRFLLDMSIMNGHQTFWTMNGT